MSEGDLFWRMKATTREKLLILGSLVLPSRGVQVKAEDEEDGGGYCRDLAVAALANFTTQSVCAIPCESLSPIESFLQYRFASL